MLWFSIEGKTTSLSSLLFLLEWFIAKNKLDYTVTCTLSVFTKQQILRLVQIESICRRQDKCNLTTEFLFGMVENIAGKRENEPDYTIT